MNYVIALIVLLMGVPIGYLLKYFTKEELTQGKKYFKILWIVSFVVGGIFIFLERYVGLSLLFIGIVSFISWKKWD
ncbi:MAG: hypothetical protein U9Q06_02955 [Nanoarchaeota archaeon]|nr:hypothetical protein [Nanoarchaeota archaeon]